MRIMKAFRLRRYRDYADNFVTVAFVSTPHEHSGVEAFAGKKILKN